jgi:DNA-binding NarL/FixJ family response regulator
MHPAREQILVVDDEPAWVRSLSHDLCQAFPDYEIIGLTSQTDFHKHLAAARDSDVAVVMADVVLRQPESGTDLLVFCRQRLPHVRRVLMSNKATREDLEDAINLCALDGYIEKYKPLRQQELSVLDRVLSQVRAGGPITDLAASKSCRDLKQITPGSRRQANLYKNTIRDLMAFAFYPWLVAPRTEVPIRNETKVLDILLQNVAREGILADLKSRYASLLVPVETKNSRTLSSSHFSQLEGYLTGPVGRWGILCFRGRIQQRHLKHVKAAQDEGKLIMLLTDLEIAELARAKFSGRQSRGDYNATLEQFLRWKYAESIG